MSFWEEIGKTFLAFATPFLAAGGIFFIFRLWQVYRNREE